MENQNPVRENYYTIVTVGVIAVVTLILFVLHIPMAVRLGLLLVAVIIVGTILAKARRAVRQP